MANLRSTALLLSPCLYPDPQPTLASTMPRLPHLPSLPAAASREVAAGAAATAAAAAAVVAATTTAAAAAALALEVRCLLIARCAGCETGGQADCTAPARLHLPHANRAARLLLLS